MKKPEYQNNAAQKKNPERKERTYLLNELALWGMVNLVKRIPKEKTCPRGKEQ